MLAKPIITTLAIIRTLLIFLPTGPGRVFLINPPKTLSLRLAQILARVFPCPFHLLLFGKNFCPLSNSYELDNGVFVYPVNLAERDTG